MKCLKLLFLFLITTVITETVVSDDPPGFWDPIWTYTCVPNTIDGPSCQRQPYNSSNPDAPTRNPMKICWLTCGNNGPLWPVPTIRNQLGKELTVFLPYNFKVVLIEAPSQIVSNMVEQAVNITYGHISKLYSQGLEESAAVSDNLYRTRKIKHSELNSVELMLQVRNSDVKIKLDTDESYTISVTKQQSGPEDPEIVKIGIIGNTYFGLRHGLETLTQLIAFDEDKEFLQIVNQAEIEDKPAFRFRGLLIDTGRNFVPFEDLKRMVDGMAQNKLNMFHWHLSDSNSLPFMSNRVPLATKYGVFHKTKVYRPEDITEFINYANLRGVKIIPELDAPSHAGNGWQWGPLEGLGELSLCINAEPYVDYCIQPPCGQLNPLNENTFDVLGKLFADFLDVFDRDLFHMGNDEVSEKCWRKYPHILNWLDSQNTTDMMVLWGLFQERSLEKLKEANAGEPITPIIWTSDMTVRGRQYLNPEDYTIHIWSESNESSIRDILEDGYSVIMSNKDVVYLDHGYGPWRGNVSYVTLNTWQEVYDYNILKIIESFVGPNKTQELVNAGKIWGGLAALWAEKVDAQNMDDRLWPRGAALAERLWTNPSDIHSNRPRFAYPRLVLHRERMVARGHRADTLLPEACGYIWGFCDNNW